MPADAPAFCPWRTEAPLPDPKTYFAVASSGENIYVLGGYRFDATTNQVVYDDTVLHGKIGADGAIAAWTPEPSFQTGRSGLGAVRLGKCLFVNGGSYSVNATSVYADDTQSASIAADGKARRARGKWGSGASQRGSTATRRRITTPGQPAAPCCSASADNPEPGPTRPGSCTPMSTPSWRCRAIGQWRIAPSGQLSVGRAGHSVVSYRDRLYVIAGSAPGGQSLKDMISSRFDTGAPLPPGPGR